MSNKEKKYIKVKNEKRKEKGDSVRGIDGDNV